MNVSDERSALRRRMIDLRAQLPPETRRMLDAALRDTLTSSDIWRMAQSVFIYWSVGDEADTHALVADALSAGKAVYMPRCLGLGVMHAVRVRALDELAPGRYGIPEPTGDEALNGPPDLTVVPGLAFDDGGGRIGYGGGYYDRYLAAHKCISAGLCYPCQLIERVPIQPHDMRMDYIILNDDIIKCFGGNRYEF